MRLIDKARALYAERAALKSIVQSHMIFSQSLDTSVSLWGSLPDESRDELARLVQLARDVPGPIIEVGTLFGFTTQVMAVARGRSDQPLITVDNYSWNPFGMSPDHHRAFTRNALHSCRQNSSITLIDGSGDDFFTNYSGPAPALVFLDGAHTYEAVVSEIRHAKRLGAAVICGDDYRDIFPGVKQAVHEELGGQFSVRNALWSYVSPELV